MNKFIYVLLTFAGVTVSSLAATATGTLVRGGEGGPGRHSVVVIFPGCEDQAE
jgi:hypothetical protein